MAGPGLSAADRDRYFAETAQVAAALGADPIPRTEAEARPPDPRHAPHLRVDDRTREVARLVLRQPAASVMAEPLQGMTMQAGIDLLPDWARRMHGLANPSLGRPLVRAGTRGVARTLRWAFEDSYPGHRKD